MSLYSVKIVIGTALVIAGLTAFFSMMAGMGKIEKKGDPERLRKLHRKAGIGFGTLLIPLILIGSKIWVLAGDGLSLRAVFHIVLAISLILLVLLKVLIVRFYRTFLKHTPVLGMTIFVLTLLVFTISAGFSVLRTLAATPGLTPARPDTATAIVGDTAKGALLFGNRCASCHHPNDEEPAGGPGLKGLTKKKTLPESGRPATEEGIRSQLFNPVGSMPSFSFLSGTELADLMAYLKTL